MAASGLSPRNETCWVATRHKKRARERQESDLTKRCESATQTPCVRGSVDYLLTSHYTVGKHVTVEASESHGTQQTPTIALQLFPHYLLTIDNFQHVSPTNGIWFGTRGSEVQIFLHASRTLTKSFPTLLITSIAISANIAGRLNPLLGSWTISFTSSRNDMHRRPILTLVRKSSPPNLRYYLNTYVTNFAEGSV